MSVNPQLLMLTTATTTQPAGSSTTTFSSGSWIAPSPAATTPSTLAVSPATGAVGMVDVSDHNEYIDNQAREDDDDELDNENEHEDEDDLMEGTSSQAGATATKKGKAALNGRSNRGSTVNAVKYDDDSASAASKKRKRNRLALNCSNCRARKVQCDRRRPACSACVKRGIADECKWEDRPGGLNEPATQTFALETVVDSIRAHFEQRIAQIEKKLEIPTSSTSDSVARKALLAAFNGNLAAANYSSSKALGIGTSNGLHHGDSINAGNTPKELNYDSDRNLGEGSSSRPGSGSGHPSSAAKLPPTGESIRVHLAQTHDSDDANAERELDEHDEANGAAMALEVLAGGDFGGPSGHQAVDFALSASNGAPQERIPLRQYVYRSLLFRNSQCHNHNTGMGSTYMRLPGMMTARMATEAVLAYLRTKERVDLLMNYYSRTVNIVATGNWTKLLEYEHEAFWHLVRAGEREFDPAWLANYCAVLAVSVAAQPEGLPGDLFAEDLYHLSKQALEIIDWRRKPSFRAVVTLGCWHIFMNFQNEWQAASVCLAEGIKAAQALGWHMLGEDPHTAVADVAFPPDSLISRELPLQVVWDLVAQDWFGQTMGRDSMVSPDRFNTAMPRNFSNDQLEYGDLKTVPQPDSVCTDAYMTLCKAEAAKYTRAHIDLGKPPAGGAELDSYYKKMCDLEDRWMAHIRPLIEALLAYGEDDWRCMMVKSGVAMKSVHLHRPFMIRGYRDAEKFGRSSGACVEASRAALAAIRNMVEKQAPIAAIWFLARQSLTAITTIYIDVLRDADIGIDPTLSDAKLYDIQYSVSLFRSLEANAAPAVKELGRKGQLLVSALEDAKRARRGMAAGQRSSGGYGKVFRRIAADVERVALSNPPSSGSEASPPIRNPQPPSRPASQNSAAKQNQQVSAIDWLDDAETRQLLSSLGLINDEGDWKTSFAGTGSADPTAGFMASGPVALPFASSMSLPQLPSMGTGLNLFGNGYPPSNAFDGYDASFKAVDQYSQYSL